MKEGLLHAAPIITWSVFAQEMKTVAYIAAPMITVTLSQYFLQTIAMMMVGHLGKLALSSTAIAISLCAVTGFSVIFGMSCALETQCGQAYGAQQYQKFGVQIYTAFCWLLVFKFGFGNLGAAFSIGTSYWLNVILLVLYMKFTPGCEATRVPITMELFHGIGEFFHYAIPSAGMICLEWWSVELLTLLSGLLPNPELETSVLSICLSIMTTIYTIPESIGSAASARVSNALGAGNPQAARVSVSAAMALAALEAILVSSIIFSCREVLGYVFSTEQDVVDYVTDMVPLLSLSVILDTLHGTLSGIARGCGWQHIGTYVNLGAYYVLGIPIAVILGFWVKLRGKGLWIGILVGAFSQTVMLSCITSCTNWEKQAIKARERLFQTSFAVEDGLV
ncbi:protein DETOXIFICATION 14-like isoform X2 [Cajanus cajan]|uniref:protein DETOXIFICATION 14-like isoform X2 n=1 Tax=Cajanus cajan TaxID=3821 RepID=UPI0010FB502E|nr:protein DETOXIFICATION 14-like isoform X2 [Cajanus cajan]